MLEVRLIRKFDIQINGEPITLSARAAQSLFAFLILTAGTKHRREKLAGMFWPDLSEQKARTYLRQEHWRIRKTLSLKKTFDYLITDDVVVTFNPSAKYDLCVARVTKLNDHASVEELIDGLTVYKWDLLPGFYQDWVVEEREHLQSLHEKWIERLLDLLETEARWQEVRDWAKHWTSLSPVSERAYPHLMQAYKSLGEPAQGTSTYVRCMSALRELNLALSSFQPLLSPTPDKQLFGEKGDFEEWSGYPR